MSNRQEPDHARIRVFTRQGFSNRRLKALEDYMRSRATKLLDEMIKWVAGRVRAAVRISSSC